VFIAVGTINLVLLTLLGVLVLQIRGFVREAEERSSTQREKILHPLLNFEQIRSIPNLRDIEILLLAVALLLILYFVAIFDKENLAEAFAQWWVTFEVVGTLVLCHALLRYTRHMVEQDLRDWHRAYQQTRDFRNLRVVSFAVVFGVSLWLAFQCPSLIFMDNVDKSFSRTEVFDSSAEVMQRLASDGARRKPDKTALEPYRAPLFVLKSWTLVVFGYVLIWLLRVRGELVTLMKSIGVLLSIAGVVGWWNITFKFDPNPANWMYSQAWAFSEWFHLCYTGVFLSLILLLFKDNMVLLGATHRAAQIIAEEKKVMVDFLVKVAEDPIALSAPSASRRLRQDLDHILRLTLDFSMRQSDAKAGTIYLFNTILTGDIAGGKSKRLVPRVVEGPYPPLQPLSIDYLETRIKYLNELFLTETVDLERHPFFHDLVEKGELLYLPTTEGRTDIPQQPTDFLKIHTLIAVPLRVQDLVLGLLLVINKFSEQEQGWESFTPQDASLLNAVADQAAIAIANARMHEVIDEQERLEREIEIARKVQESLLPDSCPEVPGFEIRAFSQAASQIGGDYYDFVWMGEARLAIVVADVAGKGIPGALTMATLRSALRALAKDYTSPRDLTIALNDFIFDDLKRDVFISVSLAILDLTHRAVSLVRAGHEPVLVCRNGGAKTEQVVPDGMALGLDRGSLFRRSLEEFTLPLEPGDLFVFYTDGVTEAMNDRRQEFTLERVIALLEESRGSGDLTHFVSRLKQSLAAFTGETPQHDDVTVVTLQMTENKSGEST